MSSLWVYSIGRSLVESNCCCFSDFSRKRRTHRFSDNFKFCFYVVFVGGSELKQGKPQAAYSSSSSSASDDILDNGFDSTEEDDEVDPDNPVEQPAAAGSSKKKNKILLNCFAPFATGGATSGGISSSNGISSLDGELDIPSEVNNTSDLT